MRDDDPISNPSGNAYFNDLIEARIARRSFLKTSHSPSAECTSATIVATMAAARK